MRRMLKFESFDNFDIEKTSDHKEKMNLRRKNIETLKDYFIELEDAGDLVDVKFVISTNYAGDHANQYKVSISSISSDIEDRINWKRIDSKYEVYWKRLGRLKLRGRSNILEMILVEKIN